MKLCTVSAGYILGTHCLSVLPLLGPELYLSVVQKGNFNPTEDLFIPIGPGGSI